MKDHQFQDPPRPADTAVPPRLPLDDPVEDDNDNDNGGIMNRKKMEILNNLLSKASTLKQEGNICFARRDFITAQSLYSQAIRVVDQVLRHSCNRATTTAVATTAHPLTLTSHFIIPKACPGCWDVGIRFHAEKILVSLFGNQALTFYKLGNYDDVIQCCNRILGDDHNTSFFHGQLDVSKLYYRRAMAHEALGEYSLAEQDLVLCLEYLKDDDNRMTRSEQPSLQQSLQLHPSQPEDSTSPIPLLSSSSVQSEKEQRQRQRHDTMLLLERIRLKVDAQKSQQHRIETLSSSFSDSIHRYPRACPNPLLQRDVIYKLLEQSSIPRIGELFYLIDFSWWRQWCLYVDLYGKVKNERCHDEKSEKTSLSGGLWMSFSYHVPSPAAAEVCSESNGKRKYHDPKFNDNVSMNCCEDELQHDPPHGYLHDDCSSSSSSCCSSSSSNSSSGSFKNGCMDEDRNGWEETGKPPGAINYSKLLLNPHGNATDEFLCEWNPNNRRGKSNHSQHYHSPNYIYMLRPQLVRGYHYEVVPREAYSALKAWYGEATPSIMRRAMVVPERQEPVLKLYPQSNHGTSILRMDGTIYDPICGRVGLTNLGNTCFMNAALQCLSHATPLTRYFLTNRFERDINASNPIGTGGKLARAYETMIRSLWMSKTKQSSISPRALKRAIALFAPRFAGTLQQDSQEFLAFLLDGLHEDLNRVRNPPYIPKADITHEHDLNVAGAEAWDAHCRRNQSIVMDTFYGQFKSTCICPRCKQISVSFDAYNHVSLEIPQLSNFGRIVPIILFRATLPAEPPQRYGIVVPKHAHVMDVKQKLSKVSQIPSERLAICDVYQSTIYEIIHDNKSVAALNNDDVIVAYEIDPYTTSTIHAIATHVLSSGGEAKQTATVGFPLFTSFSTHLTCKQIYQYFRDRLAYMTPSSASFHLKLVENNGKPMCVFPIFSESGSPYSFSHTIPDSDDRLTSFLTDDCVESYVFMNIEWNTGNVATTVNFETFSNHPSLNDAISKHRAMLNKNPTLDQCLENFTQPERLDEDNKWYCSRCKDHVRAEKRMTLWRLPNILVIHLKRFEFRNALRREKLDSFVEFPLDGLNMNKYCGSQSFHDEYADEIYVDQKDFVQQDDPAVYDLFGVVNHYGRLGFGHYTAFARRWNEYEMEDEWMLFDDSSVRGGISKSDVVSNAAYILFYRRRHFA